MRILTLVLTTVLSSQASAGLPVGNSECQLTQHTKNDFCLLRESGFKAEKMAALHYPGHSKNIIIEVLRHEVGDLEAEKMQELKEALGLSLQGIDEESEHGELKMFPLESTVQGSTLVFDTAPARAPLFIGALELKSKVQHERLGKMVSRIFGESAVLLFYATRDN